MSGVDAAAHSSVLDRVGSPLVNRNRGQRHQHRDTMSQAANNQCCGSNKRCSGTAVVVCASIATISMTICALFTFDIPLYAWFGWINVIMNVTVLVTASIFVCQCCGEEGCKPHLVQGIMMAYCALAVISFIVCASGADAAIRHNCEDTIKCDSAEPWTGVSWDDDCGQKTSRFQLCTNPDTGGGHLYYRSGATTRTEAATTTPVAPSRRKRTAGTTATRTRRQERRSVRGVADGPLQRRQSIHAHAPPRLLELHRDCGTRRPR